MVSFMNLYISIYLIAAQTYLFPSESNLHPKLQLAPNNSIRSYENQIKNSQIIWNSHHASLDSSDQHILTDLRQQGYIFAK